MRQILPFALVAIALSAGPALAEPVATIAGDTALRSGPGSHYATIGGVRDGTEVVLDFCTEDDGWCHIADYGWVNAGYVRGWAAKTYVTPPNAGANPTVSIGMY